MSSTAPTLTSVRCIIGSMELNSQRVKEAEAALYDLLGPEITQIVEAIGVRPGPDNPYLIELPHAYTVDLPLEEIASLVARTSNAFGRVARFAGMARAEAKLAKGRYDRKYKRLRHGKNEAERDANAMEACHDEHVALATAEAIAEMADSLEAAARVASESIRKIFDKAQAMGIAQLRESRGYYQDSDFKV